MEQKTHWKKLTNPNYMGTYSLENGADIIRTIKAVKQENVIGADGKSEECCVMYFDEEKKPMIMNKTNLKMVAKLFKTDFIEEWVGREIIIGSEKVRAFGTTTDALRVRGELPKHEPIYCAECGQEIKGAFGMTSKKLAEYTESKYGRKLCAECAQKGK